MNVLDYICYMNIQLVGQFRCVVCARSFILWKIYGALLVHINGFFFMGKTLFYRNTGLVFK